MPSQTLLILGANSDIARAIAHRFAKEGFELFLAARNAARLQPDVSDLAIRYEAKATALEFDAQKFEMHEGFLAGIEPTPDVVVCVFGYLGDQEKAQQDWEMAKEILAVNYTGAVSILNHVANAMEKRKDGIIVGISSVAGDRGRGSNYLYGSAKAGFTAYLSGLRNRLFASGVHVVTVKPGFVKTAMTEGLDLPPLITGMPEDVARAVYKAVKKRKNTVYTKWMWRYIMLIIRHIPEFVFKRLKL